MNASDIIKAIVPLIKSIADLFWILGAFLLFAGLGLRYRDRAIYFYRKGSWRLGLTGIAFILLGWHLKTGPKAEEKIITPNINITNYNTVVSEMPLQGWVDLECIDSLTKMNLQRRILYSALDSAGIRYRKCCSFGASEFASMNVDTHKYVKIWKEETVQLKGKWHYRLTACYPLLPLPIPENIPIKFQEPAPIEIISLPQELEFDQETMTFEEAEYRLSQQNATRVAMLAAWIIKNAENLQITHVSFDGYANSHPVKPPGIAYKGNARWSRDKEWIDFPDNRIGILLDSVIQNNDQLSYARAFEGIRHLYAELKAQDKSGKMLDKIQFSYKGNGVFAAQGDGKRIVLTLNH
jgi:hypothetical protein